MRKKSVSGYARLHKNVTKAGCRLRSIRRKCNQGRFQVTLDYTKTEPKSVPGYARLHKKVIKAGSRLRSVTQKDNHGLKNNIKLLIVLLELKN